MSYYSVLVNAGPCSIDQLALMAHGEIEDRVMGLLEPYFWHPDRVDVSGEPMPWPVDAPSTWDRCLIGGEAPGRLASLSRDTSLGAPGGLGFIANVVVARDIDWEGMRSGALSAAARWYDECARTGEALDSDGTTASRATRDRYLAGVAGTYSPATHAICDAAGWTEASGDTAEARQAWESRWIDYVRGLDPDTLLVLVDCHQQ